MTDPTEPDHNAAAAGLAVRAVQRAAAEWRRGTPVVMEGDSALWAALAVETADQAGLAAMMGAAMGPALLLLTRQRLRDLLGADPSCPEPVLALPLRTDETDPNRLRAFADPTFPGSPPAAIPDRARAIAAPPIGAGAVHLAKIARLLPSVVVAKLKGANAPSGWLTVDAPAIAAYPVAAMAGLRRVAEASVPLAGAPDARLVAFRPDDGGTEHLAIIVGAPERQAAPLVRLHSSCLTGDLLGSLRCDCGAQLRGALQRMAAEGAGVVLYLSQEGRGIGLVNKLRAYTIQDRGQDTVDANLSLGWEVDERNFLPAATMLHALGLFRIRLLTNNPAKIAALSAHGIEIASRVPLVSPANGINDAYLTAKADRLGHLL